MGENIPRWLHADIGCGTSQYITLVSIGSKGTLSWLTNISHTRNNGGAGETGMIDFMLRTSERRPTSDACHQKS